MKQSPNANVFHEENQMDLSNRTISLEAFESIIKALFAFSHDIHSKGELLLSIGWGESQRGNFCNMGVMGNSSDDVEISDRNFPSLVPSYSRQYDYYIIRISSLPLNILCYEARDSILDINSGIHGLSSWWIPVLTI